MFYHFGWEFDTLNVHLHHRDFVGTKQNETKEIESQVIVLMGKTSAHVKQ